MCGAARSSRTPIRPAPPCAPLLGEQRPALVVAPAAGDFHVTPREALAGKPGAAREGDRLPVPGLYVDLDPVQPERQKRDPQDEFERLGHVAAPGVRLEGVVTQVGTPESTAHDLAQVEYARERAIVDAAYQQAHVGRGGRVPRFRARKTPEVGRVARRGSRRPHPACVQSTTRSDGDKKRRSIGRSWTAQVHALARAENRVPRRWHNADSNNRAAAAW